MTNEGVAMTDQNETTTTEPDTGDLAGVFDMEIDIDAFTLGEVDDFEEATGIGFQSVGKILQDPDAPVGKLLRGLALVAIRRDKPETTWDDTRGLKLQRPTASTSEASDPLE